MEDQVPRIMDSVFECTWEMIEKDPSEFSEHRVECFNLLHVINRHCFSCKFLPSHDLHSLTVYRFCRVRQSKIQVYH
jgi:hypothetical protein